jgi:uncharacterized peroxidase-related enzyme
MPRIEALKPDTADGKTKDLFETVNKKMGMVPNILRTLGHSPAALEAYLGFSGALAGGVLSPQLREQVALAVGELNRCDYCISAHSAIGKTAGLSEAQMLDARQGKASDEKAAAALQLARRIVETRGFVSDGDIKAARDGGLVDAEVVEIVANVVLNVFTNYFNHVAETEIDFPRAPAIDAA